MSIDAYILLSMSFFFVMTWELMLSDKEEELLSEEWLTARHKERLRHLQQRSRMLRKLRYFVAVLFLAQVAIDLSRVILDILRS